MPLESCMILLDNSQYMRNGDYIPNRMSAQTDAVNLLITHKTQSNPESTVGVIAMNGGCFTNDGVELLVSPTDDVGKLLGALNNVPIQGNVLTSDDVAATDIPASVQVASLALKHRRNKNGQQRIVIFVGSPLTHVDKKALVKAGKGLKKNNVAIDVVAMGELEENEEKLKELVNAANGSGGEQTCHLVTIPEGSLPSDILIGTPVVHGGDVPMGGGGVGSPVGGSGGNDFAEYGGVDPNLDPELAMVLRISMEEERARQERIAREEAAARGDTEGESAKEGDEPSSGKNNEDVKMEETQSIGMDLGDEDAQLAQALAMSMAESQAVQEPAPANEDNQGEEEDNEDDEMAMALALSMANQTEETETEQQFEDPAFVQQLMDSMPGVDRNDPAIQEALKNLEAANQEKKDEDDKKGNDDNKD